MGTILTSWSSSIVSPWVILLTVSIDSIHEGEDGHLVNDREDSSEHDGVEEPKYYPW